MTVSEMISNFLLEYDRVASLSAPSYEDTEILRFLEKSQIELVNELYRNKQYMLIDDLFLTGTYSVLGTYSLSNGVKVDLNVTSATMIRYMYYIHSYSKLTRTQAPVITSEIVVQNQDITKEEIKYYTTNPFNTPIYRFPKAFLDGALLTIIPDGYTTITTVYVDYLSQPKELDLSIDSTTKTTTCELKLILHDEIVKRAVQLALRTVDPERAVITTKLNQQ